MEYPSWWANEEDLKKGYSEHNKDQPRMIDPVKAKVNKNLARYAEDSLDARLRNVQ
jgi:hypothetical protein